jgi:hypothetical protein
MRRLLVAFITVLLVLLFPLSGSAEASSISIYCWEMDDDEDGPANDQAAIKCDLRMVVYGQPYHLWLYIDWQDMDDN